MGRPIVITWAAEVRDFLRGTKDIERGLDDIADELKDAAKDADKFEAKFSDAMRDAERAADKSADKIGADFRKVEKEFADVGKESGDEFKSNLGESLASGDIEGLVTDTLGGLVASLKGPVGGAAAVLAGIGAIAFGEMKKQAEEAAAFIESTMESLNGLYESGFLAADQQAQLDAFSDWAEENAETFAKWAPQLDSIGVSIDDYVQAIYNGGKQQQDMLNTLRGIAGETETITTGQGVQLEQSTARADRAKDLLKLLEQQSDEFGEQRTRNEILRDLYYAQADNLGLGSQNAKRIADEVNRIPKDIVVKVGLDYYVTGKGAAQLDRTNVAYNPGAVSIYAQKLREAEAQKP